MGTTCPKCRQHQQRSWTASGESELSASIHLSLLPDCGHSATSCLRLLPPCLLHDDGLHPHAVSHTKLSLKLFLVRDFVTAVRTLNGHSYLFSVKQEGSQGLVSSLKAVAPVTAARHRPDWALPLTFGGIEGSNPDCGIDTSEHRGGRLWGGWGIQGGTSFCSFQAVNQTNHVHACKS